jgi:acyl dehydratase
VSIPVKVGDSATLERVISREDISAFARLSGDNHPFHTDPDYAKRQGVPDCIAHGLLTMSLLSALGTKFHERHQLAIVAYGYDRVRFVQPVYAGDTIRASCTVSRIDREGRKTFSACLCENQTGQVVLAATQITKFL